MINEQKNIIDLNSLSKESFKLISSKEKRELTIKEQEKLKSNLIDKLDIILNSIKNDKYSKQNIVELLNSSLQLVYLNNINLNEVYSIKLK